MRLPGGGEQRGVTPQRKQGWEPRARCCQEQDCSDQDRKESLRIKFEEKENVSYFHGNMARANKIP